MDLAERINNRPQLSTDGFRPYINAVEDTFGAEIDYGQLVKLFGQEIEPGRERYSPSGLAAIVKKQISGDPDEDLISTSLVLVIRTDARGTHEDDSALDRSPM